MLYDALLQILQADPFVQTVRITELRLYGVDAFQIKIRATLPAALNFQLWLNYNSHQARYAYQVFNAQTTLLRWDNAPHHLYLQVNTPHHFHDPQEQVTSSNLVGDPLQDLPAVLAEIARYLATKQAK